MFAFFINGVFFNFWANSPGDRFFEITVQKMGWNLEEVTLVHFPGIPKNRPAFFDFSEDKQLLIQNEALETIETIEPTIYVNEGVTVLDC